MKICTKCNIEKPESSFYFKNKEQNIHKSKCIDCCMVYAKHHYKINKPIYLKRAKTFNKNQTVLNRQKMIEFLKSKSCLDCKTQNYRVLEFDHKNGKDKKTNVSNMICRYSWETIMEEISKCDIRCANCHRIKTGIQFNWFKS